MDDIQRQIRGKERARLDQRALARKTEETIENLHRSLEDAEAELEEHRSLEQSLTEEIQQLKARLATESSQGASYAPTASAPPPAAATRPAEHTRAAKPESTPPARPEPNGADGEDVPVAPGACSCEGIQDGNEVRFKLGNTTDVASYRITITFVNCANVVYPQGNPADFVLRPSSTVTTDVLVKHDDESERWAWKFKWTSKSAFVEAEEDPDSFVDREFCGEACVANADPEYAWAFTPPAELGWFRAALMGDPSECLLFDEIEADDIRQGTLGDCWLMAAISAIANYPQRIESLFEQQEVTPDGKYDIRLYDLAAHAWQTVTIDDRIACVIDGGHPLPVFCRPNGEEIWPMLLEKAVAKFCGSYGALACGNSAWAFQVLTGNEKIRRYTKQDNGEFLRMIMDTKKQLELGGARNPRITWWGYKRAHRYTVDTLWGIVKTHMSSEHVAACMIQKGDQPTRQPNGLMSRHLYSFLDAREARLVGGGTVRLVRLRNPYAECAFHGDWGPHSVKWEQEPGVATQIHEDGTGHGDFWMTWEDWCDSYTFITVCPNPKDKRDRLDQEESQGFDGGEAGEVCT